MGIIESLFRRVGYSFSLAALVTVGYRNIEWQYFNIPAITWAITVLLFLLSWRVVSEYKRIIIYIDGSLEPSESSLFGKVKKKWPHLYDITWEFLYTLGAWIGAMIALDSFKVIDPIEEQVFFYLLLFISIPAFFRLCDKASYKK
ncbi:hypothetical protein AAGS61_19900 [Lysinibacillus sp. KU-BSD001]|uniref:hypothetical protein n=1 Tax=Lysinibacillus sp. KU-BSD001 TaxID=3141328 RepID=UPI0036EEB578